MCQVMKLSGKDTKTALKAATFNQDHDDNNGRTESIYVTYYILLVIVIVVNSHIDAVLSFIRLI